LRFFLSRSQAGNIFLDSHKIFLLNNYPVDQVCTKIANPKFKNTKPLFIIISSKRGEVMKRAEQPLQQPAEFSKLAGVVVNEYNDLNKLEAMLEIGWRINEITGRAEIDSGYICGYYCPGSGIICGFLCPYWGPGEGATEARLAIDVLGKSGVTAQDLSAARKNFAAFQRSVASQISSRLDPETMKKRIAQYGKKSPIR
jgi:hypothetical protein